MAAKKSYLGVDIGAGGIKLVELREEKGRGRLVTYGFTSRTPKESRASMILQPKETGELIQAICKKAGVTTKMAITSVPIASVFSSIVSIPKLPEKEMEEVVKAEAEKLSGVPKEEMVLDWQKIEEIPLVPVKAAGQARQNFASQNLGGQAKNVRIFLTGTRKDLIQKYVEVFKSAELELLILETESSALIRSLIGKDKGVIMIIDAGAIKTNVIVADRGMPVLVRAINFGGTNVTQGISDKLGISETQAEEIKSNATGLSTILGETPKAPQLFEALFVPLVNEVRYLKDSFREQQNRISISAVQEGAVRDIEKIILTGGSASLPFLAEHLKNIFKVRVFVGDPWARVIYPEDLRFMLDEMGSRFAVAIGLALRNIEKE